MEQVTHLRTESLDEIPIGIIRLSTDETVRYVNRAAREMSAGRLEVGSPIGALRVDRRSAEILATQLAERFTTQEGASYEIKLLTPQQKIADVLGVTAIPEYDAQGELIGSIAFMRSRRFEVAALEMHQIIANAANWRALLNGVAALLHRHVEFDSMMVTIISENRKHLRPLIETDEVPDSAQSSGETLRRPFKWWPMPRWVKLLLKDIRIESASVTEMFSQPEFQELAAHDPATRDWLRKGFRHLLRYPILQHGQTIAVVSLQKRTDTPFTPAEIQLFKQLPIQEAVNIAMILDKKVEADFSLDLLRDLAAVADDTDELQSLLVTRLARYYEWEHVALFSVDQDKKVFRLARQHSNGPRTLRDDYTQPFEEGLLGEVLLTRKAVVVDDITQREKQPTYKEGLRNSRAHMCLPVPGSKRLRWILSVESTQADAFADEEQQSVELLLEIAGFILDRAATRESRAAIFDAVADAVVLTSRDGVIQELNPAACQMLGLTNDGLHEQNLSTYLEPGPVGNGLPAPAEDFASSIVSAKHLASTPATVRGADGRRIPALVSGALLPKDLGGKVFVLSDLTYATRLQQLENLKAIFGAVAGETRVPLALAGTFMNDVARKAGDSGTPGNEAIADLTSKALAQIRKADLPLERLVRLAARPLDQAVSLSVLNVRDTVANLVAQLPRHEAASIGLTPASADAFVKIGASEFGFCFQSILAFLLKHKGQDERLQITIENEPERTVIAIELQADGLRISQDTSMVAGVADLKQFSFPQSFISDLMSRMGCEYHPPSTGDPRFVMNLPSV